jgi:hypothetical protein
MSIAFAQRLPAGVPRPRSVDRHRPWRSGAIVVHRKYCLKVIHESTVSLKMIPSCKPSAAWTSGWASPPSSLPQRRLTESSACPHDGPARSLHDDVDAPAEAGHALAHADQSEACVMAARDVEAAAVVIDQRHRLPIVAGQLATQHDPCAASSMFGQRRRGKRRRVRGTDRDSLRTGRDQFAGQSDVGAKVGRPCLRTSWGGGRAARCRFLRHVQVSGHLQGQRLGPGMHLHPLSPPPEWLPTPMSCACRPQWLACQLSQGL